MREWAHPVCLAGRHTKGTAAGYQVPTQVHGSMHLLLKAALWNSVSHRHLWDAREEKEAVTQSIAFTARAKPPLHALSRGKYSSEHKGYTRELKTPHLQYRAGAELGPACKGLWLHPALLPSPETLLQGP